MIPGLLDHIWQSSLFAAGIGLLTLLFRKNGAAVRFWLWFAASLKFLLPFALLAKLGEHLSRLVAIPESLLSKSILAIQPAAEKLSAPAQMLAGSHGVSQGGSVPLMPLLAGLWLLGFAAILVFRLQRWMRLRAVTGSAVEIALPVPVKVKASASLLEPGLVGILRPVVLLPQGLMARLSGPERDSILAHELSHLRRRDNVTALVHMMVEALFWFYPPVWLIGTRLIAERERACDESVLALGHDPEIYAGGILKVCKFCIRSPLACASGASGADLKHRLRLIMTAEVAITLSPAKRLLLAGAALLALAPPVLSGFPNTPLAVTVSRKVIMVQARAEQAMTAVVQQIAMAPAAPVTVKKLPRPKLAQAPVLPPPQIEMASLPEEVLPAPEPAPAAPPVVAASSEPAPQAKAVLLALNPIGAGDPDAITCRAPQQLPGTHLPGPKICQPNRVWAQLHAHHQDFSPDGRMVMYLDDFSHQKSLGTGCHTTAVNGPSVINLTGIYCF
ncbi:MAG TPA: M56 family metallopeptidase [Rhizomicrobium sp.]|nr:M56 family metallopeptidase [Rhizomicrobium sp.]